MGRNVKDGSQFSAPIIKAAKLHCKQTQHGVCPSCKGEFATGASGVVDHKLPFALKELAPLVGLTFIGQRENAVAICSDCNHRKSKIEQKLVKDYNELGLTNEVMARVIKMFRVADEKSKKVIGSKLLNKNLKAMRQIETATRDKRKLDTERAKFNLGHRRANQRRALKRRKVVNFD